jgi:hypothetical protein
MNSNAGKPRAARRIAVIAMIALGSGCIGYSRSAKRWAYVGNSGLIGVGGGALALGILSFDSSCSTTTMTSSSSNTCIAPVGRFSGISVVGAVLVVAGLVGIVLTATRPLPHRVQ